MRDRDIVCVYGVAAAQAALRQSARGRRTQSAAESASPTRSEAEWKLNAQSTVILIDLYSAILLARRGSVLNCGIYVLS